MPLEQGVNSRLYGRGSVVQTEAFAGCVGDETIEYLNCPAGSGCMVFADNGGLTSCDPGNGCDPSNNSNMVCKTFCQGGVGGPCME